VISAARPIASMTSAGCPVAAGAASRPASMAKFEHVQLHRLQARRLNIRSKSAGQKGTSSCTRQRHSGRRYALSSPFSNYQQADGSIVIPEACAWVGRRIPPRKK
jgi:hypothetical protein